MTENKKISLRGARIEAGMKKRGEAYTQEEVAEAIGVSRRTFGMWERGDIPMKITARMALAYFYEMDYDDFDLD